MLFRSVDAHGGGVVEWLVGVVESGEVGGGVSALQSLYRHFTAIVV